MKWRCTKHNVDWDISKEDVKFPPECPWCMQERNDRLHKENIKLKEHRDIMVSAIDLVQQLKEVL